jgi:putative glycerol-1-phosphate prenyltransferase
MACSKVNLSQRNSGDPGIWVLLDPDRFRSQDWEPLLPDLDRGPVQGFLVGGSLQTTNAYQDTLDWLAEFVNLPVVLFPGSMLQVSPKADALLLLSLISGRNPEYLIGQHVQAAVSLRNAGLTLLPTGYMLVDGGKATTAHYITQTQPIPADKPDIAAVTALAGSQLGLKVIYLDCGSGALHPVPTAMVEAVRQVVDGPLMVGGGVRTPQQALALRQAGADWVVMGSVFEENPVKAWKALAQAFEWAATD